MQIFVDSAEIGAIRDALTAGLVTGVTTNPTLLRRAGVRARDVPALVEATLAAGAREIHLQVYGTDTPAMVRDAAALAGLAPAQVVVKIPATPAGYAAGAQLVAAGRRVTLTAVYTVAQTILAASSGAHYAAVYLGRMRDAGLDAPALIGRMQTVLDAQHATLQILAASVREPAEVELLAALGVASVTLPPAVLGRLLDSPATAGAATVFTEDAKAIQ